MRLESDKKMSQPSSSSKKTNEQGPEKWSFIDWIRVVMNEKRTEKALPTSLEEGKEGENADSSVSSKKPLLEVHERLAKTFVDDFTTVDMRKYGFDELTIDAFLERIDKILSEAQTMPAPFVVLELVWRVFERFEELERVKNDVNAATTEINSSATDSESASSSSSSTKKNVKKSAPETNKKNGKIADPPVSKEVDPPKKAITKGKGDRATLPGPAKSTVVDSESADSAAQKKRSRSTSKKTDAVPAPSSKKKEKTTATRSKEDEEEEKEGEEEGEGGEEKISRPAKKKAKGNEGKAVVPPKSAGGIVRPSNKKKSGAASDKEKPAPLRMLRTGKTYVVQYLSGTEKKADVFCRTSIDIEETVPGWRPTTEREGKYGIVFEPAWLVADVRKDEEHPEMEIKPLYGKDLKLAGKAMSKTQEKEYLDLAKECETPKEWQENVYKKKREFYPMITIFPAPTDEESARKKKNPETLSFDERLKLEAPLRIDSSSTKDGTIYEYVDDEGNVYFTTKEGKRQSVTAFAPLSTTNIKPGTEKSPLFMPYAVYYDADKYDGVVAKLEACSVDLEFVSGIQEKKNRAAAASSSRKSKKGDADSSAPIAKKKKATTTATTTKKTKTAETTESGKKTKKATPPTSKATDKKKKKMPSKDESEGDEEEKEEEDEDFASETKKDKDQSEEEGEEEGEKEEEEEDEDFC